MIVVAVTVAISCMVFTSFVSLFLLLCFVFFCCSFLGWLHLINSIVLQLVTISLLQFCFSVRFLFVSLVGTLLLLLLLLLLVLTLNNSQATWSWCDCCRSHTLMFCPPNELSEQQQSTVTISSLLLVIHMLSYYSTPQLSADVSWWSKYSASSSPSIWYERTYASM